jgi:catechol 2,3-dioxygenase-like lactoylglutathione lyase family enzyme
MATRCDSAAVTTPGHLQRAVPVLAALDLDRQVAFYRDKLGFAAARVDTDFRYAILERDDVEVHLYGCDDRHVAENTSCYLRVRAIGALWSEYRDRGVDVRPLEAKPWGMTEFEVIDPDGNLLRFGESPRDVGA